MNSAPDDRLRLRVADDGLNVPREVENALRLFRMLRPGPPPGRPVLGMGYMMVCHNFQLWVTAYLLVWGRRPHGNEVLHWVFHSRPPGRRR